MRPTLYEELYNPELKNAFLQTYDNPKTANTVKHTFMVACQLEQQFETDVKDFSKEQLIELWLWLSKDTPSAVTIARTHVSKYIDWCISNGHLISAINNASMFKTKDLSKYANQMSVQNKWIKNRQELYEICDECYNPQDAVIIALLYECVWGRPEKEDRFEAIINLTIDGCDFENNEIITTFNNGTRRGYKVHPKTMELVKEAYEQEYYYPRNGHGAAGKTEKSPLIKNQYIVKPIERRDNASDKALCGLINSRIARIAKIIDKVYIKPTNIFQSGYCDKCRELEEKQGELTKSDYRGLCKQIGRSEDLWFTYKTLYESFKKING